MKTHSCRSTTLQDRFSPLSRANEVIQRQIGRYQDCQIQIAALYRRGAELNPLSPGLAPDSKGMSNIQQNISGESGTSYSLVLTSKQLIEEFSVKTRKKLMSSGINVLFIESLELMLVLFI